MSEQSLYRKYRPQDFSSVHGQSHITSALTSQIESKNVGHAYLFSGSRGLGKTSIARIFARELGCTSKDLYEIDAASNNSVDDIRALTENIYTLPFESPYKVYILDEAHMLSKGAWNALLKTLEEPPKYVIFILATTELEKVPETVQSRCQVFECKKPTREGIATLVREIAKLEEYIIDSSVADLIALLSEGSYRDSLSILQKIFASSTDRKISREEAEKATGAPKLSLVMNFVEALGRGNTEGALTALRAVSSQDVDMTLYLTLVLETLRTILLVRHAPELHGELKAELGSDQYPMIETLAKDTHSKITHTTLRVFLDASSRIRFAHITALPLELAVYELNAS
jgi:DNA polymerase III subunit gamma/tau